MLNTFRGRMRGAVPKDGPMQRALAADVPKAPGNPFAGKNAIKPGVQTKALTRRSTARRRAGTRSANS